VKKVKRKSFNQFLYQDQIVNNASTIALNFRNTFYQTIKKNKYHKNILDNLCCLSKDLGMVDAKLEDIAIIKRFGRRTGVSMNNSQTFSPVIRQLSRRKVF